MYLTNNRLNIFAASVELRKMEREDKKVKEELRAKRIAKYEAWKKMRKEQIRKHKKDVNYN